MHIQSLEPGVYVVAVSGGVDSVVLLDLLRRQQGLTLVVAHFDHGIRHDSSLDRDLVRHYARQHALQFVYDEGRLGRSASEARARAARYEFLRAVRKGSGARAIITAHHQDDRLETAAINLIRGTQHRGIVALRSRADVIRPLLNCSKAEIVAYARTNGLVWREDSTNSSDTYLRNRIRKQLAASLDDASRRAAIEVLDRLEVINEELDSAVTQLLQAIADNGVLDRRQLARLPHAVAREVVAAWLRSYQITSYDQPTLERLVVGIKTLPAGARVDVGSGFWMGVKAHHAVLHREQR